MRECNQIVIHVNTEAANRNVSPRHETVDVWF